MESSLKNPGRQAYFNRAISSSTESSSLLGCFCKLSFPFSFSFSLSFNSCIAFSCVFVCCDKVWSLIFWISLPADGSVGSRGSNCAYLVLYLIRSATAMFSGNGTGAACLLLLAQIILSLFARLCRQLDLSAQSIASDISSSAAWWSEVNCLLQPSFYIPAPFPFASFQKSWQRLTWPFSRGGGGGISSV